MSWLENLKEGDQVVEVTYAGTLLRKVQRITATQIVLPNAKFNRKTGRVIGGSVYAHTCIREATPEMVEKARLCGYRTWLVDLKPEKLTLLQLESMYRAYKGEIK